MHSDLSFGRRIPGAPLRHRVTAGMTVAMVLLAGAVALTARTGALPRVGRQDLPALGSWQALAHQPGVSVTNPLLLTDGTVIAQQYGSNNWRKLTADANGSYVNGTWSSIASMPTGYNPLYFASAVLPDGRVVAIGGEYLCTPSCNAVWTSLGAAYDPSTNVWTALPAPAFTGSAGVGDAQSVVLPDGRFMIGNLNNTQMATLSSATLTWTTFTAGGKADRHNEEGWTLLPENTILTVNAFLAASSEKYVIASNSWVTAGSTIVDLRESSSAEIGPQVLKYDGKVFVAGSTINGVAAHTAIYTPGATAAAPGSWAAGPDFPTGLGVKDGPAAVMSNGVVLVMASPGFNGGAKFFEFDGTSLTQTASTPNAAFDPAFVGTMLELPTGQILLTDQSGDVEVYTPSGAPNDAWRPTISSSPAVVDRGSTFTISGTQFNGLSQGAAYGDDAQSATNYPLVRITNRATGHVSYAKTHGHSTMAVATGSATVSTSFDVSNATEFGSSDIEVVTNGIASAKVPVTVGAFVNGVVTDAVSGLPVAGATLTLNPGAITLVTDASGNYGGGIPVGVYSMTAGAPGHAYQTFFGVSVTGGPITVSYVLPRSGSGGPTTNATTALTSSTTARPAASLDVTGQAAVPANVVNDASAPKQATGTWTVPAPAVTLAATNRTVSAGHPAQLTAVTSDLPSPAYQWQVLANPAGPWTNLANGPSYTGTTTATLTVSNAPADLSAAQYRVVVTSPVGSTASAPATLTVSPAPPPVDPAEVRREDATPAVAPAPSFLPKLPAPVKVLDSDPAAQRPRTPPARQAARPAKPVVKDTHKWEIEVFAGKMYVSKSSTGTSALPAAGAAFTTAAGKASRRVSSWYFGDGASLLNDVNTALTVSKKVTPLDAVLTSSAAQFASGVGGGVRVSRVLTRRLTAEFSLESNSVRLNVTGAGTAGIEATRASFLAAFNGLAAAGLFVNPTVTSVSAVKAGTGRQLIATGAVNLALTGGSKVAPYVTVGGGVISNAAGAPSATLTGDYQFLLGGVTPVHETDSVAVRFSATRTVPVGVLGGGVKFKLSSHLGFRFDARVYLGSSGLRTFVDATPSVLKLSPAGSGASVTNPGIQFSNDPTIGIQSNLTGAAITGFQTFTGSGLQHQTSVRLGVFFRF